MIPAPTSRDWAIFSRPLCGRRGPACYRKRFCNTLPDGRATAPIERICPRAAGPTDKNRRANWQLRPPGGNRSVGIMNEASVGELHHGAFFVPKFQAFPKAFAKAKHDAQHITHCKS